MRPYPHPRSYEFHYMKLFEVIKLINKKVIFLGMFGGETQPY